MTIGTWIGKYAIVRHVLVGGTATVVHFGTYYALTALSVNYNLAFTVASRSISSPRAGLRSEPDFPPVAGFVSAELMRSIIC